MFMKYLQLYEKFGKMKIKDIMEYVKDKINNNDKKELLGVSEDFDWTDDDFDEEEDSPIRDPHDLDFPLVVVVNDKLLAYINVNDYWPYDMKELVGKKFTIINIDELDIYDLRGNYIIDSECYYGVSELDTTRWYVPFECVDI